MASRPYFKLCVVKLLELNLKKKKTKFSLVVEFKILCIEWVASRFYVAELIRE